MKKLKWIVSAALILVFSLCFMFISNGASAEYSLGDTIPDFTFTTYDGRTLSLYETLEEKDMVVINIWATWCGPCQMEFPYMEEAYQLYKDDIEIFALSCESTDTDDILAEFAASVGTTFPMGSDNSTGLANSFGVVSIPTTIVIDRNGTICFIHSGAVTETAMFTRLFDTFAGDDYDESVVLTSFPPAKPALKKSDADELSAALNSEDGNIVFANSEDEYVWPMVVTETDGRSVVISSNRGNENTTASVNAEFTANTGDVVMITFKTSCEPAFNSMVLTLDGEKKKVFSGASDWMTYAIAIEEDGNHVLDISYVRTSPYDSLDDAIWIDSVEVLSGEEAAAALAANPAYPTAEFTRIEAVNEGARRVYIDDPDDLLEEHFGECEYYVLNDHRGEFLVHLSEDIDPESAVVYTNYDGSVWTLADFVSEDGYRIFADADSLSTTGYTYTTLYIFTLPDEYPLPYSVTFFADEANLSEFAAGVSGNVGGWHYAEENAAENAAAPAADSETVTGPVDYSLKFIDQNGDPVSGVMAQVCNDTTCMVYTSDENGICAFALEPFEYEIHLLMIPEGYSGNTDEIHIAPYTGGEMIFELNKN